MHAHGVTSNSLQSPGQRRQEYMMGEKKQKTVSSISGPGKTGKLHVKEWN